jgi:hypothetical protein
MYQFIARLVDDPSCALQGRNPAMQPISQNGLIPLLNNTQLN